MKMNNAKSKWRAGAVTYGAWLSLPDSYAAESIAHIGFDWVCIDMQHGVIDYADAVGMLRAVAPTEAVPFVRVPWNEPGIVGKVLDAGAFGIIVPMVNSVADAEAAVAACRYAPGGRRSYGPNRVAYDAGPDYYDHADKEIACIPMIETAAAVDSLDAILSVPRIDAVYVGPADLSITLGLPPRMDNGSPFIEARNKIAGACKVHGIIAGIHANAQLAAGHAEAGFQMITIASDVGGMVRAAKEDLAFVGGAAPGSAPLYS